MNLDDRVIDLIAQLATVKRADIKPQDRLRDDLGLDSVSSMELLSLLAEELQLDIPVEEATAVTTVAEALAMAHRHSPGQERP
jgi:acyl carrier protein